MSLLNKLNVRVFDPLNEHRISNIFLLRIHSVFHNLNHDTIWNVFRHLKSQDLIQFLLSCVPLHKHVLLTDFTQGKRSEIGSVQSAGFGCHGDSHQMLVYGKYVFEVYSHGIHISWNTNNILKLVSLLRKYKVWSKKQSRTIDEWRKQLIAVL